MIDASTPPHIVTAVAALAGALIGSIGNGIAQLIVNWRRTKADGELAEKRAGNEKSLAERRFEFDKDLAERKVRLDAKVQDRRRRQDLAEELISGFYEISDIMRAVRSPFSYSTEGATREKDPDESPEETRRLNSHFVIVERFNRHRDTVARIMSREYRAVAWFGSEIRTPFEMVHRAINEVLVANDMIATHERHPNMYPTKEDRELLMEWRRTIYGSGDEKDVIASKLREATSLIETACRSVLEEPQVA